MAHETEYVWGADPVEQKRLLEQTELYKPEACWLLDRLNLQPAARAIDLGCGPLGILDLLAERVGPQGQVVGVEFEPRFVEMAKRLAAVRKLNNVTVLGGDATGTGLPGNSFHLAHARLLLIVVPSPERVVAEMARLVRPGGAVAVEEVDICSWICEPPHPAWTRLFAAFETIYQQDGKDLKVGRRIRGLLRAAGLKDVGVNTHCRVNGPGDFHQEQLLLFIKLLRGQIIARELLQEGELNTLIDELAAHLHDPGTLVVSPILFQAWGYKPD
jgi:SAM-dependent methyltransferase